MCEDYPELVELATTPEDAYRLEKKGKNTGKYSRSFSLFK